MKQEKGTYEARTYASKLNNFEHWEIYFEHERSEVDFQNGSCPLNVNGNAGGSRSSTL